MSQSVTRLYEYSAAASVQLPIQPAIAFPSTLHTGPEPSAIIPLDLSASLGSTSTPATSPNLLASFVRIHPGSSVSTKALCSSQLFYVIRGSGVTTGGSCGEISWSTGDTFTLPGTEGELTHTASAISSASLYWVHDEPLLRYLGVAPSHPPRFSPALYTDKMLRDKVEEISHEAGAEGRNRKGVLMGHEVTEGETKTITPVLWALLNVSEKGGFYFPFFSFLLADGDVDSMFHFSHSSHTTLPLIHPQSPPPPLFIYYIVPATPHCTAAPQAQLGCPGPVRGCMPRGGCVHGDGAQAGGGWVGAPRGYG